MKIRREFLLNKKLKSLYSFHTHFLKNYINVARIYSQTFTCFPFWYSKIWNQLLGLLKVTKGQRRQHEEIMPTNFKIPLFSQIAVSWTFSFLQFIYILLLFVVKCNFFSNYSSTNFQKQKLSRVSETTAWAKFQQNCL